MIKIQADTIDELVIIQEVIDTGIVNFRSKVYTGDDIRCAMCDYELGSEHSRPISYLCSKYGNIIGAKYEDGTEVYSKEYKYTKRVEELVSKVNTLIESLDKDFLNIDLMTELHIASEELKELSRANYNKTKVESSIKEINSKINQYHYDHYEEFIKDEKALQLIKEYHEQEELELWTSDEDVIGSCVWRMIGIEEELKELGVDKAFFCKY